MPPKYVPPSVHETAFNCPRCAALAKQFWYSTHADALKSDGLPAVWTDEEVEKFDFVAIKQEQQREDVRKFLLTSAKGVPFLEK
ncbi:hypothetical protein [Mesorhizobium sp. M0520]|uniref:hypothetical protein n=1 Tax=Mesorhizobium sp. M0520 TaxID=2956957 RepID=UPI0033389D63